VCVSFFGFRFFFYVFKFVHEVLCTWAINEVFLPQKQIKLESNSDGKARSVEKEGAGQ